MPRSCTQSYTYRAISQSRNYNNIGQASENKHNPTDHLIHCRGVPPNSSSLISPPLVKFGAEPSVGCENPEVIVSVVNPGVDVKVSIVV